MPSSTSSSNPTGNYRRIVALTLLLAAAMLVLIELVSRYGLLRVSRIERRTNQEFHQAMAIRPAAPGQPANVLILGNSLLLAAMDDSIQQRMAPQAHVTRFVVEQTSAIDWRYGIRRLLASGAKPDYLILCLGPTHLTARNIRGDYSSFYLFQPSDIPAVSREVGYGLTTESSLFFAHYSMFWAGRANLRNFLLHILDPPYSDLLHRLTTHPAIQVPPAEVAPRIEQSLRALGAAAGNQPRFAVAVAPSFQDYDQGISEASAKSGVPVLSPFRAGEIPREMYADDMHVNETGAARYTAGLARMLKDFIAAHPVDR